MSLLIAAMLLSAQAAPQPQTAVPATPAQVAKPIKEKKICRRDDDTTGSHMVKRTCLTQSEWDARAGGRSADQIGTLPTNH